MSLWRGAKPARRVQAKQLENQASGQLWAAFYKLLVGLLLIWGILKSLYWGMGALKVEQTNWEMADECGTIRYKSRTENDTSSLQARISPLGKHPEFDTTYLINTMPNFFQPLSSPSSPRPASTVNPTSTPALPKKALPRRARLSAPTRCPLPARTVPLASLPCDVLSRERTHYFGAVDHQPHGGTAHSRVRAAADSQWVQHRKGNELTVRPGSVVAPQTLYTGSETRPNGQEVQHAIFLNARMLVHNPATGEPAPTADKPWDLEVPYPSAAQVGTALTTYGPTVHREVGLQRRPGLFRLNINRQVEPSHSFPSPPTLELARVPVHHPVPRRPAPTKAGSYRFLTYPPGTAPAPGTSQLLDTGLIDEETGHEVLALPTGSGSARPASPRPGTPAPPRRMYETRPVRVAPKPKRVSSD
ncbi:hypothetical protein C8R47DRAFT_1071530, partial [Mycena vitilis]